MDVVGDGDIGMNELDRIPVGFKTRVEGNTYRHIVLVIKHKPTNTYVRAAAPAQEVPFAW